MKTATFLLAVLATGLHAQVHYEVQSPGVLPGYVGSVATAINKKGAIVGYSFDRSGNPRAFLYENCKLYDLGSLGGGTSVATGINDAGLVVGYSTNNSGVNHAFSWSHGVMVDAGGGPSSVSTNFAAGVSNTGHAVGYEITQSSGNFEGAAMFGNPAQQVLPLPVFQGTVVNRATAVTDFDATVGYSNRSNGEVWGVFFELSDYPGYHAAYRVGPVAPNPKFRGLELATQPNAVNRKGMIAGIAGSSPRHAFLAPYLNQPAIDLGTFNPADPSLWSSANGINNSDYVVGWSDSSPTVTAAFLYDGSSMIDLNTRMVNPAGWQLISANAINDNGQIVGMGSYNGQTLAFVLLPNSSPHVPSSCLSGKLPVI